MTQFVSHNQTFVSFSTVPALQRGLTELVVLPHWREKRCWVICISNHSCVGTELSSGKATVALQDSVGRELVFVEHLLMGRRALALEWLDHKTLNDVLVCRLLAGRLLMVQAQR